MSGCQPFVARSLSGVRWQKKSEQDGQSVWLRHVPESHWLFSIIPCNLQVRGTTRHTPSADAVGTGPTTSRRAPALRADTPQPGSESVSLPNPELSRTQALDFHAVKRNVCGEARMEHEMLAMAGWWGREEDGKAKKGLYGGCSRTHVISATSASKDIRALPVSLG